METGVPLCGRCAPGDASLGDRCRPRGDHRTSEARYTPAHGARSPRCVPRARHRHRDQDVRPVVREVADIAQETRCTIILVRHLHRASSGNALYRGGGSVGIVGAVRVGWRTAADPDDEAGKRSVLTVSKANLAKKPPSLGDRHVGMPEKSYRVEWLGERAHPGTTLPNAQASRAEHGAATEATQFLLDALAARPCPAEDVERQARALDIVDTVLRTASGKLGIMTVCLASAPTARCTGHFPTRPELPNPPWRSGWRNSRSSQPGSSPSGSR